MWEFLHAPWAESESALLPRPRRQLTDEDRLSLRDHHPFPLHCYVFGPKLHSLRLNSFVRLPAPTRNAPSNWPKSHSYTGSQATAGMAWLPSTSPTSLRLEETDTRISIPFTIFSEEDSHPCLSSGCSKDLISSVSTTPSTPCLPCQDRGLTNHFCPTSLLYCRVLVCAPKWRSPSPL